MALGELEENTCIDHNDCKVALFCQSCEELICTKCISQGPSSVGSRHRDHIYLDIAEAYDMHKEEMEKLLAHFQDTLQNKKSNLRKLQNEVQNIKFEVLRKQTEFKKTLRSFKDHVAQHSTQFMANVHTLIQPSLAELESAHKSVEYEVVSEEGVLGGAEATARLPPSKCITFLQNLCGIKREMSSVKQQTEGSKMVHGATLQADLCKLRNLNLSFHREKKLLQQVFTLPTSKPSAVKPLWDWCIVGATSACITWKCQQNTNPVCFRIYYKPYQPSDLDDDPDSTEENYSMLKIRNTTTGRVHAILHKLKPETVYTVKICAVNQLGSGEFCQFYIDTYSTKCRQSVHQRPPRRNQVSLDIHLKVFAFLTILLYACILTAISVYAYGNVFEMGCNFAKENWNESYLCELARDTVCGASDVVKTAMNHVEDKVCGATNFPAEPIVIREEYDDNDIILEDFNPNSHESWIDWFTKRVF